MVSRNGCDFWISSKEGLKSRLQIEHCQKFVHSISSYAMGILWEATSLSIDIFPLSLHGFSVWGMITEPINTNQKQKNGETKGR